MTSTFRFKFSLASLLVLVTLCTMVFVYMEVTRATVHSKFLEMLQAQITCHDRLGWEGPRNESATFEDGVPAILKPHLDALPHPMPAELVEYLSTSVPAEENYESYEWTFLTADNINETLLNINGSQYVEAIQYGYFVFAVSGSNFAAISLKDGRVYSSYLFEDGVEYEAENIKQFIDVSTQDWINHEP